MELKDATIGQTYIIDLDDCCVEASFKSKLIELVVEDDYLDKAIFENGVIVFRNYNKIELVEE